MTYHKPEVRREQDTMILTCDRGKWTGASLHLCKAESAGLRDVIAFAKAHPALERLTLPYVDLASVPEIAEVPVLGHELQLLTVHFLKPKLSLHRLGLVLDRLFPDLYLPENLGECKRRGDELNAFLFALQAGRRGTHRLA